MTPLQRAEHWELHRTEDRLHELESEIHKLIDLLDVGYETTKRIPAVVEQVERLRDLSSWGRNERSQEPDETP